MPTTPQADVNASLNGFYRVQPTQPGFAILIFKNDSAFMVQRVGENGLIEGFLDIDIEETPLTPFAKGFDYGHLTCAVGDEALYAFQRVDQSVALGTRKDMTRILLAELKALADRPFLLLEVMLFILNQPVSSGAREMTLALLKAYKDEEEQAQRKETLPDMSLSDKDSNVKLFLKTLTIAGFRSFADKTTLHFEPGLTAIVGPNGCGKSNIADAIRWVLGDTSANELDEGYISATIFNGTDNRDRLNEADIELTIASADKAPFRIAGFESISGELIIGRRLVRNGDGAHSINKIPCHLKDLQLVLTEAGIGRSNFNVMTPANIVRILSSKPEDRMQMFYEATGITRLKARDNELVRKLEYTELNLVRIGTLLLNIEQQRHLPKHDASNEGEQSYELLKSQYDDLVRVKAKVLETEKLIATKQKERFLESFSRIRENFRGLFTEVFGGGRADLVLVGDVDASGSGIDIVARPPGKQLQTISLLSGGEQTMTAVALLFSIYQVKPSPFCVLDEFDALLDESNINRFVRLLVRFLPHSQFILISHHKHTIGAADLLYGVTMEERGVSKVVSVKFHRAVEPKNVSNPEDLKKSDAGKESLKIVQGPTGGEYQIVGGTSSQN